MRNSTIVKNCRGASSTISTAYLKKQSRSPGLRGNKRARSGVYVCLGCFSVVVREKERVDYLREEIQDQLNEERKNPEYNRPGGARVSWEDCLPIQASPLDSGVMLHRMEEQQAVEKGGNGNEGAFEIEFAPIFLK